MNNKIFWTNKVEFFPFKQINAIPLIPFKSKKFSFDSIKLFKNCFDLTSFQTKVKQEMKFVNNKILKKKMKSGNDFVLDLTEDKSEEILNNNYRKRRKEDKKETDGEERKGVQIKEEKEEKKGSDGEEKERNKKIKKERELEDGDIVFIKKEKTEIMIPLPKLKRDPTFKVGRSFENINFDSFIVSSPENSPTFESPTQRKQIEKIVSQSVPHFRKSFSDIPLPSSLTKDLKSNNSNLKKNKSNSENPFKFSGFDSKEGIKSYVEQINNDGG